MKYGLIFVSLVILTGFTACQERVDTDVIVSSKINCPDSPKADPLFMREVKPIVTQDKDDIYWISLSAKHYENLSLNTSDILDHIKQKNVIIQYYNECIEDSNNDK